MPAKQRGYLLVTVVMGLFLLAAIAVTLNYDSAISANTASKELESARADYVAQAGLQNALWRAQNNACMGEVTIPDTPLGADTYAATIKGAAAGTLYKLTADQDAWIRSDDVTRNNGTTVTNHIRQELGNVEQVLTRFDLTTVPAGAQINSAIAWFHLKALKPHPQGAINVHEVTADWTEAAVTWESFAGSYRGERIAMLPAQDAGDEWVAINLTGLVQAWVNDQPNFGILFNTQAEGIHTEYTAREDGTNPPRLEVVVGSGVASPVTIKAKSELDNGVKRNLSARIGVAYQPPATLTLQLGTDPGADAMLDSFYPRNYGGADYFQVTEKTGDWQQRPVLRFGLGAIPAGASVRSAQLQLRLKSVNAAGTAAVHRVTRGWIEGTEKGTGTADGATWATYDGTNPWASEGGDFQATAVAETAINGGDTWVTWEIGPLVEQWLAGEPNNGLLIRSDGVLEQAAFYSKEETDATLRPRLTITYACECGTPCMSQTGSGNLLMAVISPTVLVDEDQKAKDLFESWGYTVSTISESASQSSYDSAVAANDVVFISETVNSKTVGSKLVGATIGVVSQDGDYNPDLGLATDSALKVGTGIDVTSTDHYITRPFRVGSLPIYTAGMEQLVTSGPLTAGQQTLAEIAAAASLVVLEKGDALEGGGSAAGRRIVLPFGTRYRFDWDRLNANGRLLLQRSVSWGMGAGKTSAGRLLLVVGDIANPSGNDKGRLGLLESWGYTVTLIDDGAGQAEFDIAFAAHDVVYVSGDVSETSLGTKVAGTSLGVVNEQITLHDEMGFSSASGTNAHNAIFIEDNTHSITDGFATGWLFVASADQDLHAIEGTVAPGLQMLATTWITGANYKNGLSYLETGAELFDGGNAAGRRVLLPWGAGSFNIEALNDDGKTVMHRAIRWAAGAASCTSSSSLLFVVGDTTSPSTQETARRNLLESWCYSVTLIDDSDSQANFDTAASNADVAYISSEVSASALGTKLKDNSIGIVTEDPDLHNDYGFSTVRYRSTTNAPLSTDSAHYITSPFAGADITLFDSTQPAGAAVGTLPSGLVTLGSWTSGDLAPLGGLLTLETGAAISGGGTAAGRRVQMPWDGTEGGAVADIAALSADGQTVLQRSLEWGAGAGDSAIGPVAHWKLDETGGTTAVDSAGGHDGSLTNMDPPNDWVAGELDGALDFDGGNDHIDIPYDSSLSITGEMSFTAWVNLSSPGSGYQTIVTSDDDGSASNYWFGAFDDELAFGFYGGPGGFFRGAYTNGLSLQPGTWYHLGATFDDAADEVRLYVDGTEFTVESLVYSPTVVPANISLGRSKYGEYWRGLLDDVRIYDYVLDAVDIAELAASGGGLIAHWKLDDGTGLTAIDSEGGHDGTLANGPVWVVGQLGDALRFDGADDYVDLTADAELVDVFDGGASVAAWIYPTGWGENGYGRILDKSSSASSTGDGWVIRMNADNSGVINFGQGFTGGRGWWKVSNGSISLDTWQHVAIVYDASSAGNDPTIYLNGSSVPVVRVDSPSGDVRSDSGIHLRLGNFAGGTSHSFDGVIDDVRIYSYMLSATEITGLAGGGSGGGGGGGGVCGSTFRDEFNNESYANNDGSSNWSTDWLEINENDGWDSGDEMIDNNDSDFHLRIRDNDGGGEGVQREADLSASTAATFSFEYRRDGFDNDRDFVMVQVSNNGGGSWTELDRILGPGTDSSYVAKSYDISSSIANNTRIRFLTSSNLGSGDELYIDNVEIAVSGCASP